MKGEGLQYAFQFYVRPTPAPYYLPSSYDTHPGPREPHIFTERAENRSPFRGAGTGRGQPLLLPAISGEVGTPRRLFWLEFALFVILLYLPRQVSVLMSAGFCFDIM